MVKIDSIQERVMLHKYNLLIARLGSLELLLYNIFHICSMLSEKMLG